MGSQRHHRTRSNLPNTAWSPRMDHPMKQPSSELRALSTLDRSSAEVPASAVTHPVLSRLLEEVRNAKRVEAAYDRVHNRHNRGR